MPLALVPDLWFVEWWRVRNFSPPGPGLAADRKMHGRGHVTNDAPAV